MSTAIEIPLRDTDEGGLPLIIKATKCVNAMPSGRSRDLYNSHIAYRRVVEGQSEKILEAISSVIRTQGIRGSIVKRKDKEEKFELLQECNDAILEKINSNLDDLLGVRNPDAIVVQESLVPEVRRSLNASWHQNNSFENSVGVKSAKLLTARNIQRPQASFKTPVDNTVAAFYPRLKYKPHSIKPLSILPEYDAHDDIIAYTHPYETELDRFEPPEDWLTEAEPIKSVPIETGPLMYVDDEASLKIALKELEQATELAVDVEHHSYRTFQGITCLLQVSSRTKDYIFDTIALREELSMLNEVFANPKILKVFHGAIMDIDWLQRDLSIYVVGMFDTFEAAKRLNFARLSLAFLLSHYCKIDVDKTFQLADWRMRPLLEELIDYARQDTHYLLFIYDNMRNDLMKASNGNTNLVKSVFQASADTCKKRYYKPRIGANSYIDIYRKSKKVFDNRQLYGLQQLFAWRDKIAREEDESYGFVMPNHMMLQIAESLPREMQGILACCNPIPPLVKQHLPILHRFILKAREQNLVVTTVPDESTNRESQISNHRDYENPLYCPHDIMPADKLPCMFSSIDAAPVSQNRVTVEMAKPQLNVFVNVTKVVEQKDKNLTFVTPFQRYKLYLPIAQAQRQQEEAQEPYLLCPPKADESVAEKHKLEQEEVQEERIIKKRRVNLPGPSHSIEIFGREHDSNEDEEKRIVEELAHSKSSNKKQQNGNTNVNNKPLSKKKQRQMQRRLNKQDNTQKQKGVQSPTVSSNSNSASPSTPVRQTNNNHGRGPQNFKKQPFKKNRQDSNQPVTVDLTQVDYSSRFGGGSKQQPKKQFQITQKFQSKSQNKTSHRGNFKR